MKTLSSGEKYDYEYFECGTKSCYHNYRWLPELTRPMVAAVMEHCEIEAGQTLLDFGCSKGYCVRAFRERGIDAWGTDISAYAIAQAPAEVKPYITHVSETPRIRHPERFDWLFCKDVLEHIELYDLIACMDVLSEYCKRAFIVVPLGDGTKYNAAANELDTTHIHRQPLEWWTELLRGWWPDVAGTYRVPGMKEQWTEPQAHGFIVCK